MISEKFPEGELNREFFFIGGIIIAIIPQKNMVKNIVRKYTDSMEALMNCAAACENCVSVASMTANH